MSKTTVSQLQKMKQEGTKFATITAYDATFARLFDEAGIPVILIGDSLGMVMQGHSDTLPVTIDEMAYHTRCVRRGTQNALVVADMSFMSYSDPATACRNAATLMAAGASMVKIEGGEWLCETVKQLQRNGVPVCGHLGLTPETANEFTSRLMALFPKE